MQTLSPEEKAAKARSEYARFQRWLWSLHALAAAILGLAMFPMVYFLCALWRLLADWPLWSRVLVFSFAIGPGYFLFGLTLIFLCVAAKNLFGFRIREGLHPMYSIDGLRWMAYNSMILIANAAFLDVLRISPFQNLFYGLMGAKVGKDVNVNTGGLADLSLLEIGDHVVIGGGTALICHAVDRGLIRLERTHIGDRVSIGIGSVIMPGCWIGDGAALAPCTYLPRGSRVPDRALWGGNPARDLRAERRKALSAAAEGSSEAAPEA